MPSPLLASYHRCKFLNSSGAAVVATHNNRFAAACLSLVACALSGCAAGNGTFSSINSGSTITTPAIAVTGQVYGGQQPISSASVMLWKVNTDGTAATALLNAPVTTRSDGTGGFTITGFITNFTTICAANPQVYVTAVGGNPGAGSNSSLALMAAIGNCSNLTTSTHIAINEATTVAAVWALQQFFGVSEGAVPNASTGTPGENIVTAGTTQSNAGMVNAFLTANQLVNYTAGAVTANTNAAVEGDKLYAIANVLAACVNSNGTGDCPSLFSAVTPAGGIFPGDTIQAALYMAQNPTYNVATVYALQSSTPPFASKLASAPFDWSLAITYSGASFNLPNYLASDASGNIWITNSASSSSSLTKIAPGGATTSYLTGSSTFKQPQSAVIDTNGNGGTPLLTASVSNIYGTGTIYGSASVTVDSSWIGTASADGLYFKFGAYSGAPNTGNPPGDQTQVTFAFPASASGTCSTSSPAQFCISHP